MLKYLIRRDHEILYNRIKKFNLDPQALWENNICEPICFDNPEQINNVLYYIYGMNNMPLSCEIFNEVVSLTRVNRLDSKLKTMSEEDAVDLFLQKHKDIYVFNVEEEHTNMSLFYNYKRGVFDIRPDGFQFETFEQGWILLNNLTKMHVINHKMINITKNIDAENIYPIEINKEIYLLRKFDEKYIDSRYFNKAKNNIRRNYNSDEEFIKDSFYNVINNDGRLEFKIPFKNSINNNVHGINGKDITLIYGMDNNNVVPLILEKINIQTMRDYIKSKDFIVSFDYSNLGIDSIGDTCTILNLLNYAKGIGIEFFNLTSWLMNLVLSDPDKIRDYERELSNNDGVTYNKNSKMIKITADYFNENLSNKPKCKPDFIYSGNILRMSLFDYIEIMEDEDIFIYPENKNYKEATTYWNHIPIGIRLDDNDEIFWSITAHTNPSSSFIIVGSAASGKTTQINMIKNHISKFSERFNLFCIEPENNEEDIKNAKTKIKEFYNIMNNNFEIMKDKNINNIFHIEDSKASVLIIDQIEILGNLDIDTRNYINAINRIGRPAGCFLVISCSKSSYDNNDIFDLDFKMNNKLISLLGKNFISDEYKPGYGILKFNNNMTEYKTQFIDK